MAVTHVAYPGNNQNNAPASATGVVTLTTTGLVVGDRMVVMVGWAHSTATLNTVTDSASNTYTQHLLNQTQVAARIAIYSAPINTMPTTVTATFSATPTCWVVATQALRGVDTTTPVTAGETNSSSGTTAAMSSGAVTPSNSGDLLVAAIHLRGPNTDTLTAVTGWTTAALIGTTGGSASGNTSLSRSYITGVATSQTYNPTDSTAARTWGGAGVTFNTAAAAATPARPVQSVRQSIMRSAVR
jgi:hypothetical protein